ncbi:hypothetical protein OIO90_003682 [Microbotryomycetes sp. JL221]|nr:hypothetical protein OIO90_003682 [Microbotryomycetes sp. JL221]
MPVSIPTANPATIVSIESGSHLSVRKLHLMTASPVFEDRFEPGDHSVVQNSSAEKDQVNVPEQLAIWEIVLSYINPAQDCLPVSSWSLETDKFWQVYECARKYQMLTVVRAIDKDIRLLIWEKKKVVRHSVAGRAA